MLFKEAGMSRGSLIASLSVVGCALAGATILVASVFPLKAAPRAAVRARETQPASKAVVDAKSLYMGKVKRGTMYFDVRGLGTLALLNGKLVAKVELPENQAGDVRTGESAQVDTHKGIVRGHVSQVSPEADAERRSVLVALDSAVPSGVDAHTSLEAIIRVGELENVVYVGRPVNIGVGPQGHIVGVVYKIIDNGREAERLQVEFGRAGVSTIQVLSGLKPGDTVILSDMSPYQKFDRVEIKPTT